VVHGDLYRLLAQVISVAVGEQRGPLAGGHALPQGADMSDIHFAAGDMTFHRVVESEIPLIPLRSMLPGLDAALLAENRGWLAPAALDAQDRAILCIQSYVVRTPHHIILVDSCVGNHKERPAVPPWHQQTSETYARALAAAGLGFGDIDYVMCTHLHVDHVGWNTRLQNGRWVPSFPKARYIFGAAEFDHAQAEHAKQPSAHFADSVLPVMEAGQAELVGAAFTIGDHVRLLPTPGHTPGHVAIAFGKGADHAVVTGDLLHSPLQARYPEMSSVWDADPAQAASSRRALLERFCDTDTRCCFAHFPSPSTGQMRRWGDGFRCDPIV